jgi:hypothetical protein
VVSQPVVARQHVLKYGEHHAFLSACASDYYSPLLIAGGLFLVFAYFVGEIVYKQITVPSYSVTIGYLLFFSISFLVFGFLALVILKRVVLITELLLIPKQRKVIIRRARSKKVLSEHCIDNIALSSAAQRDKHPLLEVSYWFTLYDIKTNALLFAIYSDDEMGIGSIGYGELNDLYKQIMYPEHYAKQRLIDQKKIEEQNLIYQQRINNSLKDGSKWDSLG